MNNEPRDVPELWSREPPRRTRPRRGAGGFYRTAEGTGPAIGGVPLNATEDAVVAAVRLAYKVAETQVDRSTRFAQRLREAGDRAAGPGSESKAVDAMEDLVLKTLMSGLAWWEGSVAEGRCPVKRLMAAEFQLLATLLGSPAAQRDSAPPAAPPAGEAQRKDSQARSAALPLQIAHKGARRAVRVIAWEIADAAGTIDPVAVFYSADEPGGRQITGDLSLDGRVARLTLDVPLEARTGIWRAAICNRDSVQLGIIEIAL